MIVSGLLLLAACGGAGGGASPLAGTPVAVAPLAPTAVLMRTRYDARARLVLRSQEELNDVWARLYRGLPQPPAPPAVDFTRDMALFAALGTRPSGGHAVAIPRAALDGGVLRVEVVETRPGAGCMTTQALTYPVALVRVARHAGRVEFVERVEANACR
jgi:hypothetical protein